MSQREQFQRAPKTAKQKVPVPERALIQRLNRKLAKRNERLLKSRPAYDVAGGDVERLRPVFDPNLGEFYIVDTLRNLLASKDVSLEALAREEGVLAPREELVPS